MGIVYKAEDTNLGRFAALKFLPEEMARDPRMRARFHREARAASALNHPNICTIYEIDEDRGRPFIAMELLEGGSLKEILETGPLPLQRLISIAIDIADGLDDAHKNGIIHRDIKAANIFVTKSGRAKVLDFGLAKMDAAVDLNYDSPSRTQLDMSTAGMVLGTIQYMSPEQVLGKPLDATSDLFSFGIILYLMAAGRLPFQADSSPAVFVSIVHETPTPLPELNPHVPRELARIIGKCLKKAPELRYQRASEISADLRKLQRDVDSGKVSTPSQSRSSIATALSQISLPRAFMSVTKGVDTRGRQKRAALLIGAGLLIICVVPIGRYLIGSKSRPPAVTTEEPLRPVPLTTYPGYESSPSLSPDGNQVAFAWDRAKENKSQIYVKLIGAGTGDPLRLTDGPYDTDPSWSPSGRWIAFRRSQESHLDGRDEHFELRIVGALGGAERKLADLNGPTRFSWSADNQWILCGHQTNKQGLSKLVLISVESGETNDFLVAQSTGETLIEPTFSPDNKKLAYVRQYGSTNDLLVIPLGPGMKIKGTPVQLAHTGESSMSCTWTPDSTKVVYEDGIGNDRVLWEVRTTNPAERRRVDVRTEAFQPSISLHGNNLAYARGTMDLNIWRAPTTGSGRNAEPATFIASSRDEREPQYSPDGMHIAFTSERSGNSEIWVADSDGSHPLQITSLRKHSGTPRWSPDGKTLAFDSNAETPFFQIYTIAANGGKPRRLTDGAFENAIPSWSQDSQWIYFECQRTGRSEIWKIPPVGGTPRQVTTTGGFTAFESADGRWVYFTATNLSSTSLMKMPAQGGEPIEVLKGVHARNFALRSRGVYYMHPGPGYLTYADSIAFYDFVTRKSTVIVGLARPVNLGLAVSPDGKWLLYSQLDQEDMDLMLLENFH
jgi:serine/threonine protein kinase